MPVQPPPINDLRRIGERHGLGLTEADLNAFRDLIIGTLPSYEALERLPEQAPPAKYPRTAGRAPGNGDNPLNAWYWRCSIAGSDDGPLAGKVVAIKDNVTVAGVPMMNGCSVLEGYVPEYDATVVTRILDGGARIVGKSACEDLCLSGGSHTCRTGPVRNPWDPSRSAGGSSSGSAVVVATGEVDLAVGGDQGGSIRIPSSWCGTVGHKPTRGLVPYTGAFPIEMTLDHLGPIGRNVSDVATMLEVMAGVDGLDPRQPTSLDAADFTSRLDTPLDGLKVGLLKEGFGLPASEEDVDGLVREAAKSFEDLGARVSAVSVPMHLNGMDIWGAIATEGAAQLMVKGNGFGTNWEGFYATSLMDAFGRGRRARGRDLSVTVKMTLLLSEYLQEHYQGRYYAKAQNVAPILRAAYDDALRDVDVLIMPTQPMKATVLPGPDAGIAEVVVRAQEMLPNAAPFDVTDHPAISVPCGVSEGLPVGMMIVGRRWEDLLVLRAARMFEQHAGGFDTRTGRPPGAS